MPRDFYSLMQPTEEGGSEETSSRDFFSLMQSQEEPTPEKKPGIFDSFGKGLAYQLQSGGFAGAPTATPEQAKRIAADVGTQAAVSGAFAPLKYLASLSPYAPRALQFILGLGESATAGAAVPAAAALVEGEELPSKEDLLKEGALWAGIDLGLQALHLGANFAASVNRVSKEFGTTRMETIRRSWEGAKKYYGWKEPPTDPATGVKIIPPEQIELLTKTMAKEPETIMGQAKRVKEPTAEEFYAPAEKKKEFYSLTKAEEKYLDGLKAQHPADLSTEERELLQIDLDSQNKNLAPIERMEWRKELKEKLKDKIEVKQKPSKDQLKFKFDRKKVEKEKKGALEKSQRELQERKDRAKKQSDVALRSLGIKEPEEAATDLKEEGPLESNPDEVEGDDLAEESLSPEETVRAQVFAEAQLLKDKTSKKLGGIIGKVDVERPFKQAGAPNTGRAVKVFHDTINAYLEESKWYINTLGKLNLSKDQLWESFLAAETGKDLLNPEMNAARDLFRDYFDQSFLKYKEAGGLSLPWPDSAINRLEQEIVDLKTKLNATTIAKRSKGKIEREVAEIRKAISVLKKLKYIPKSASLITQALADSLGTIEPKYVQKFAVAAHKRRTTGALSDWISKEPKIKELLHPYDFIGDYAYKKGKDLGLLGIVKNAIDEGLATKGEQLGFKMDPIKFPALAGYNLHPALYEYITNLTNPIPFNAYDKISRWAKSSIVFDPTYLGTLIPYFRTIIQHPKYLARLPKYWKKAVQDFLNKSPDYIEFVENGGASNPYPETGDYKTWLEKEKLENGSLPQMIFNSILTKDGAQDLLNKMANFSWMVDRMARLAYYNMLIDKGFDPKDAAKLAAENFVDYSKLPAKTRRWLGRIFFAPATQVLSIINDVALSSSPFKLAKDFFKNKNNFKSDNINKERVRNLLGTIVVLGSLSALYKMWGFKEEEFGTRYVSPEYEGSDGKMKESVITPTHPLNYSLRWINTFMRGFGPGESSPVQKLWGRMINQIGPVPSMIQEIGNNKDRNGKHIWDPIGDDAITASAKVLKYILGKIEPFVAEKFHTAEERKAARSKIKEIMGWSEWFMDSLEFFYERKPDSERRRNKINYLKREMKKLEKSGELTEKGRERYQSQIQQLIDNPSTP